MLCVGCVHCVGRIISSILNCNKLAQVPDSCCKSVSRFCGVRDHPSNIYYTGCAHKLSRMASDHLLLIGTIALVICAVEACGVVLSATLVRKLSKLDD